MEHDMRPRLTKEQRAKIRLEMDYFEQRVRGVYYRHARRIRKASRLRKTWPH